MSFTWRILRKFFRFRNRQIFFEKFGFVRGYLISRILYPKSSSENLVKFALPGFSNHLYLRANTSDVSTFSKVFLEEEYSFITTMDPKFIIDAGANIGLAALYFLAKYENATVIAVEPESHNLNILKKNLSGKNYKAIQGAIWNKKENLKIKNLEVNTSGFEIAVAKKEDSETIPAYNIEELMKYSGVNEIDILKIDIEGSEREVFSSDFERWLPKTKILIIETHDRFRPGCEASVEKALSNYSFKKYSKGENLYFVNKDYRLGFKLI